MTHIEGMISQFYISNIEKGAFPLLYMTHIEGVLPFIHMTHIEGMISQFYISNIEKVLSHYYI